MHLFNEIDIANMFLDSPIKEATLDNLIKQREYCEDRLSDLRDDEAHIASNIRAVQDRLWEVCDAIDERTK